MVTRRKQIGELVSKNRNNEDVVDVTGIRKCDTLLQVGKNMQFMKKYVKKSIHTDIDSGDALPFLNSYEKIFVNNINVTDSLIEDLCMMNNGLIVFFIDDDNTRAKLQHKLETYHYPAEVWNVNSNVGKCLITDARSNKLLGN